MQAWLESRFAEEPYAAMFSEWAAPGEIGVKFSYKDREASAQYSSKRPMVWISIPDGAHQRELWRKKVNGAVKRGTQHNLEIVLELFVSEAALPALQKLRDALATIFDENQYALRPVGFDEAKFAPDSKRQQNGNFIEPHTLTCVVRSLPN